MMLAAGSNPSVGLIQQWGLPPAGFGSTACVPESNASLGNPLYLGSSDTAMPAPTGGLGPVEDPELSSLAKRKCGRPRAPNPLEDPTIPEKKARRIMANRASADRSKRRAKLALAEAKAQVDALKAQLADVTQQVEDTQGSLAVFELVQSAVAGLPAPASALHNLASQLRRAGKPTSSAQGTNNSAQPRGQKRKLLQQQAPHVSAQQLLYTAPMAQQEPGMLRLPMQGPLQQQPLPLSAPLAGGIAMWQGPLPSSLAAPAPAPAPVSAAELQLAASAAATHVAVTMQQPTVMHPSAALSNPPAVPTSNADYGAPPPLSYAASFAGPSLSLPQAPVSGQQLPLRPPLPQQQQRMLPPRPPQQQQQQQLVGALAGVMQALSSSLQQPRPQQSQQQQELRIPAQQPFVPQSAAWGAQQQQQQVVQRVPGGPQHPQPSSITAASGAATQPTPSLEHLLQQVLASMATA